MSKNDRERQKKRLTKVRKDCPDITGRCEAKPNSGRLLFRRRQTKKNVKRTITKSAIVVNALEDHDLRH